MFKLCGIWKCVTFGFKFKFAEKKIQKAFLFSLSGPKSISTRVPLAAQSGSLYFFCFYFRAGLVSFGLSACYRPSPLIVFFLQSSSHRRRPKLEVPRRALWLLACLPRLLHSSYGCCSSSPPHLLRKWSAPDAPPLKTAGALKHRCRPSRLPFLPCSAQ
jgi:hypothetical protein